MIKLHGNFDNMLQLEVGDAQKTVTKLATEFFQRFISFKNIYIEFLFRLEINQKI